MSQRLVQQTSRLSLVSSRHENSTARPRLSRNCSNCVCSPGLLSRQNRRASIIAKRMNLKRSSTSGSLTRSSTRASLIGEDDELCKTAKEINTSKRLEALRHEMKSEDIAVYIVPSEDEHQSEYVSPKDQRRSFISGFSGSAGIAVITRDPMSMNDVPDGLSALSTDGRYFIQAENELDFNWKLLKQGVKDQPTWQEWAILNAIQMSLDSGLDIKIGINSKLFNYTQYSELSKQLKDQVYKTITEKKLEKNPPSIDIIPVKRDLIDAIWSQFEIPPTRPASKLMKLTENFTGDSVSSKICKLRNSLKTKYSHTNFVVTSLDQIAWLLNLRGSDIQYNPIFYSFFILTNDRNILFCDLQERLDDNNADIAEYLATNGIEVKPYSSFYDELVSISGDIQEFLVPNSCSWAVCQQLKSKFKLIDSPIELLKAVKNSTELSNFKVAHSKDGIACIKFFAWLEDQLVNKEELINEHDVACRQEEFRKEQPNYVDLSFETISSTGSNAAIIHYAPPVEGSSVIDPSKIYLNDSGAQYLEGTTDITRTYHFTQASEEEKQNYTLVLKGNIAIENLKFPEGTNGYMIDSIARQFLWRKGLDYKHGTSHGVGAFLNVHEGPIGIGFRPHYAKYPLQAGNVISNEPGYYKTGEYGIRIENVVYVTRDEKFDQFLKCVNMTRVPYCRELIDTSLLLQEEIEHINSYHDSIWREFNSQLKNDCVTLNWLKRQCQPL
ncbi:aminopeptidase P [Saccharomycopsis crataegensis]|uniref:Xaa-Pro aminopeptidase n=1 Tax=Saccharomycopsis crataegensis TaxID=43959 RepID=A0AAV5QEP8_9ASCO|nr:aminopeptidase P [Saccharomycopsis crataegensis]